MAATKGTEKWMEIIRPQDGKKYFEKKKAGELGEAPEESKAPPVLLTAAPSGADVEKLHDVKRKCEKDMKYCTQYGLHKFITWKEGGVAEFEVLKENWTNRPPAKFYVHSSHIMEETHRFKHGHEEHVQRSQQKFWAYNDASVSSGCICF